jgi:alpha,alpha-trehalose phosphorylase
MAARNLVGAADVCERHQDKARELGVTPEEMADWRAAADRIFIPYDKRLGVHPQAEGFTDHDMWNFAETKPDQYPLMLHFPYFDLYRKQVVKQPDLVLAMQLCCDAFTDEQKVRNFDYYERITVRDSSLSACTQAVLAAEVGHLRLALDYAAEAALIDLQDLEHNVRDGLHIASLAGTWIALVNGFGGMRDHAGVLSFAPRLPDGLTSLSFSIVRRKLCLRVEVTASAATYRLTQGTGTLQLIHHGEPLTLTDSEPIERQIPELPPLEPTAQPPGREPRRRSPGGVSR